MERQHTTTTNREQIKLDVLGAWSRWNEREKEEQSPNVSFKGMLQLTRKSTRPHLLEALSLSNSTTKKI